MSEQQQSAYNPNFDPPAPPPSYDQSVAQAHDEKYQKYICPTSLQPTQATAISPPAQMTTQPVQTQPVNSQQQTPYPVVMQQPIYQVQSVVTVLQQPVFTAPWSHEPQQMVCPVCHIQMMTRVEHRASSLTHVIAIALCILCIPIYLSCWCGLFPYCELKYYNFKITFLKTFI